MTWDEQMRITAKNIEEIHKRHPPRAPLKRSRLKPRTTPVRKRRPGGPRRGPAAIPAEEWRNPAYLSFLARKGRCRACRAMKSFGDCRAGFQSGYCDPMHGPVNGGSSKGPDAGAIPGCRRHHDEQHEIGWPRFEAKYGFTREEERAIWRQRFLDQERG